jgi:hypothetical protein
MTEQEAQLLVDRLLSSANPRQKLNNVQSIVLEKTWAGYSYQEIAAELGYQHDYIRQIGFQLWRTLSQVVGEEVSKKNVQAVLRRYAAHYPSTVGKQEGGANPKSKIPNPKSNDDRPTELHTLEAFPPSLADETRWVGREPLVDRLSKKMQANCRVLMLVGLTGIGKSSLAVRLSLEAQIAQTWLVVKAIRFDAESPSFEGFASQVLGQQKPSTSQLDRHPEQVVNELVTHLQNHPCLCILDMVEEILTASDCGELQYRDPLFAKFFDRLLELESMPSRLILTSQDRPPAIAEGRYKERSHLEELKGLNPAEALELFRVWEVYPRREEEVEYLQRIIEVYEGHPLALSVIAGEIREIPYDGDVRAYWHDYGGEIEAIERQKNASDLRYPTDSMTLTHYSVNLTDLVKNRIERTFDRLSTSSPLAYILLCMGATYRCAVERTAWLILIADSPKEAQITAFQTLQRRFLLETDRTVDRVLYRLHGLIRSIALQHLANRDLKATL